MPDNFPVAEIPPIIELATVIPLKRPKINYLDLPLKDKIKNKTAIDQIEAEIKYIGYIKRQKQEMPVNAWALSRF